MKSLHDWGLLVLRIGTAGLLIPHGWGKLNKLIAGLNSADGVQFYNFMGIGETPSLMLTVLGELHRSNLDFDRIQNPMGGRSSSHYNGCCGVYGPLGRRPF